MWKSEKEHNVSDDAVLSAGADGIVGTEGSATL